MLQLFHPRSPAVVSEIIDGEAIILDLRSGVYFSAQDAGAVIWDGLAAGFSTDLIELRLAEFFIGEPTRLQTGMAAMIADLIANDLIEAASEVPAAPQWSMTPPTARTPFTAPVLHRYGDLQDLARLDPIHDVAEDEGWPNRRSAMPDA